MRTKYVPLSTLIGAWSRQSGELPPVILTNLCDRAARGGFPPATFRHIDTGDLADPGSLPEVAKLLRFVAYDSGRADTWKDLAAVMALKSGVLSFCRLTGTRPPRCVAGIWRWFLWRHARHAAPPPYPSTPEEIAAESEAAKRAQAELDAAIHAERVASIEISLSHLETLLGRYAGLIDVDNEFLSRYSSDLWDKYKALAQDEIRQMSNTTCAGDFTAQLKELDSRYESLKAQADTLVKAAGERVAANTENVSRGQVTPTIGAERKARRYLQEQVQAENWRPKDKHFEEVRAICGAQLSRRGFERVWSEVAPPEWRARGRRSAQGQNSTRNTDDK